MNESKDEMKANMPRKTISPAEKAAREQRRAADGDVAMAEYKANQQAELQKTARLKALRAARDAAAASTQLSDSPGCRPFEKVMVK